MYTCQFSGRECANEYDANAQKIITYLNLQRLHGSKNNDWGKEAMSRRKGGKPRGQ